MKKNNCLVAVIFIVAAIGLRASGAPSPPFPPAQSLLPQTSAEKAAEAYVKAFNAGEEAMKDFLEKFFAKDALQRAPLEARLARYRQIKGQLGILKPEKAVESGPNFFGLTVRAENGQLLRLDFEFEAAEPHGLLGIRFEALGGPGDEGPQPDPKKDEAELFAAVRDYAAEAAAAGNFSGAILIAKNGVPVFEEAYGFADRKKKIPNRIGTKFNIGSINKSFTSLAVRKLAAEKKLSLEDTIGKFLPDYPNKVAASMVRVRHLLAMSSGIGDFFGPRYEAADKEKILTLAEYLPLFADQPLAFEPGQGNLYSNGGYIVLGLIIEKITGQDYYDYIRDNIYRPAGMTDSGWTRKADAVPGLAVGYVREGSSWKTNYDSLPGIGSSAGGGHSTARDLLKYTIALEKGLFGPAGEENRGGMGIAGGAPGLNAGLEWMPDRGWTIVVMANLSPPAAMRVARQIRAWLPR